MINCGRNLNFFLMDGNSSGRVKCTLANWTGVIYKMPKEKIHYSRKRKDLQQSGVYLLIGENKNSKPKVYVGQAGLRKNGYGIYRRVHEHIKNKDFWDHVLVITTLSDDFGPTEISYLETVFYLLIKESKKAILKNNAEPNIGNISEEKKSELDEFIKDAILIIETLGYDIFKKDKPSKTKKIPILEREEELKLNNLISLKKYEEIKNNQEEKEEKEESKETENIYYIYSTNRKLNMHIKAKMKWYNEKKVKILKGSIICPLEAKSLERHRNVIEKRKNLLVEDNILQEDFIASSPSEASGVVLGRTSNGWTEWKDKHGKTLEENIRKYNKKRWQKKSGVI